MKIIHCADLHIDCKGFNRFPQEKKAKKRYQHLQNFVDMVKFAEENCVTAILLCGDVFDEPKALKKSLKVVQETILSYPNITFFYIWGNHDENLKIFDKNPSNFVAFGNTFDKIDFGDVCIGGISYQRQIEKVDFDKIDFDTKKFNILMMHGPMNVGDQYSEPIPVKKLANKGVNYLALGHIHKKEEGTIDKGGIWAFSGCLEAKNFNNTGNDYGFVLLDISNKKMTRQFVPFAKYNFQIVEINVSNIKTNEDLVAKIVEKTAIFGEKDILKIVFVGKRHENDVLNFEFVLSKFSDKFFHLEMEDQTKIIFDLEKYANEKLSLKAEFIKEVMADQTLTEEEKQQICLTGLEVLKGEDISL